MLVDCAHYVEGSRQDKAPIPVEVAVDRRDQGGFVWLGLHDPGPDELEQLAESFGLPPLAVEDARHAHQRPKLEDYDDGSFLVLHTARYIDGTEEVELGEVHMFTGPDYAIHVRHGAASDLHAARMRLERRPNLMKLGPTAAVWAVLDKVVDDYRPVIEGMENDVNEVEEVVFSEGGDQTRRVYFLRQELADFQRAVRPLMGALDTLQSRTRGNVPKLLRNHLRDVQDHLRRVDEEITLQRDALSSIFQANLALIGLTQNDVMRKISGWAAIIAVPTFLAGIWGMNFESMPELSSPLGYPLALLAMVVLGIALYVVLRRARWL